MTLILHSPAPNPLMGFTVDKSDISLIGHDLQRAECILSERDGTLWAADARGGVMRIAPDGVQTLILQSTNTSKEPSNGEQANLLSGTLPNGMAFTPDGELLIANFGTERLEMMTRDGDTRILLDNIEGRPLGKVNFVLRDRKGRLWITVSTLVSPWNEAICPSLDDGYIILLDKNGARIVADGFHFTNEIRLDANEDWLYVAETTAKRVTRLRVHSDGSLTHREVYGPSNLGDGLIDGIAFDAYGNLWATMVFADRLVAITPEGNLLELFSDGDANATAKFEAAFATGKPPSFDLMMETGGTVCTWITSIAFGGEDLSTVYLGTLRNNSIPCFQSPVPGLPMVHW